MGLVCPRSHTWNLIEGVGRYQRTSHEGNPTLPQSGTVLGLWNEPMQDLALINHKKEMTGPTFFGLKVYIKNMETIEHKIVLRREKLGFHHKKWDKLTHALWRK